LVAATETVEVPPNSQGQGQGQDRTGLRPSFDEQVACSRCSPSGPVVAYGRGVTGRRGIETELAAARAQLDRVTPQQTKALIDAGGLVVDTRTETQRRRAGEIPGAVVIDRTVLEWRLDPACPYRIEVAPGYDEPVVVVCAEGYSSSLAAASLQRVGLLRATDMIGGFEAWVAAGLPVVPADSAEVSG
jgi:rhodanese-related sulfurtransferase